MLLSSRLAGYDTNNQSSDRVIKRLGGAHPAINFPVVLERCLCSGARIQAFTKVACKGSRYSLSTA